LAYDRSKRLQLMPAALIPREEVVDRLLRVFRRSGFEGASLGELSAATGLGRSSLYHYFPGGKDEMARAVLDRVDSWLADEIIQPLEMEGGADERLARMVMALHAFFDGGRERCVLGAFVVGRSRDLFASRLSAIFERWIAALANLARSEGVTADDAHQRAERVVAEIQGAIILSAALSDRQPFERALERIKPEMLGH
jgi:AcrR family transcriptional regulator